MIFGRYHRHVIMPGSGFLKCDGPVVLRIMMSRAQNCGEIWDGNAGKTGLAGRFVRQDN